MARAVKGKRQAEQREDQLSACHPVPQSPCIAPPLPHQPRAAWPPARLPCRARVRRELRELRHFAGSQARMSRSSGETMWGAEREIEEGLRTPRSGCPQTPCLPPCNALYLSPCHALPPDSANDVPLLHPCPLQEQRLCTESRSILKHSMHFPIYGST